MVVLISSFTSGAGGVLQLRDAEVDFYQMPTCSSATCVRILNSLLGCGTRIRTDCFCRKPNPLVCAWSVDWSCWNRTEDWYNTQCPGKPLVDLTDIPECALSCFSKKNVCKKLTTNCVCSQPKPDCNTATTTCKSADLDLYNAWYTKSCEYNLTAVGTGAMSHFTTETSTSTLSASTGSCGPKGLSTGAIAGVAIGAAAGGLALGALLWYCCRSRSPGSDGAAIALGQHEIEDYSYPKIRPDLIPSMVQSTPLVEAPGDSR